MTKNIIRLNRELISRNFWEVIFKGDVLYADLERSELFREAAKLDSLRAAASYNTGSISPSSCWTLFSLSSLFKPRVISEVGTFIGRSTLSIVRGLDYAGVRGAKLHTCDYSNDIVLPVISATEIHQYRRQSSSDMFLEIQKSGDKCDFFHIDGRLQKHDVELMGKVMSNHAIIALDDFEGIEKGVVNASVLMEGLHRTHSLIYPPREELLEGLGHHGKCTTAVIVPSDIFQFTTC